MLAAIWAQDEQGLIGNKQKMPWHLPNDLNYFKQQTQGNILVMGRSTFEGMDKRPLPNRHTIILSRHAEYKDKNLQTMHCIEDVLALAKVSKQDIYIAGGAEVYKAFLPHVECLYRTVIQHTFQGDTYFPQVNWSNWLLKTKTIGQIDEKNEYVHQFEFYCQK